MKQQFIVRDHQPRLLLIFAGWAMDANPFASLRCSGYDIAVIWDYRSDDIDLTPFGSYDEIAILAWSMGVWAASRIIPASGLPVTLTIAVNGSPTPVDALTGIPPEIYHGTIAGLSQASLSKFYRRMAGSSAAYTGFANTLPQRPVDELADELRRIEAAGPADGTMRWDKAVISSRDAIFPIENMRRAWTGKAEVIESDAPHLPDFNWIIDRWIIDKPLVERKFSQSLDSYDAEASIQNRVADHLWSLWQKYLRHHKPSTLIEIGYGTGYLTSLYAPKVNPSHWELWDLIAPTGSVPDGATPVQCDAEVAIRHLTPASIDTIVSASAVQWFNSLPTFLSQCARVLSYNGLAVISTFGNRTFRELAQAGAEPLPYITEEGLRHIIPDEFEVLELHQGIISRAFDTPTEVMRHIRATGVNALRRNRSAATLRHILANYPLAPDGRALLTYNPIYLIIKRK